jgi:hypothetical protein
MEKDDFMPKIEEKTPEQNTLEIIIDEFSKILKNNDKHYDNKIFFNVSYKHYHEFNQSGEYYKINIFPISDRFNSQKYFIDKFERKIIEGEFDKFSEENNIGIIEY